MYSRKVNPLVVAMLLHVCGFARGADRYVLDIPPYVMAGETESVIRVTPMTASEADLSPQVVEFGGLSSGVRLDPIVSGKGYSVEGPTSFRISVDPGVNGRRVFIRVQKKGDKKIFGTGFLNVEKTVAGFSLTPFGMSVPRAGIPYRFQVLALDADGAVVTSFKGNVEFYLAFGALDKPTLGGEAFKKGKALVDLVFQEGDPLRMNRLEARASTLYAGQTQPASGFVELIVQPGVGRE